MIDPRMLGLLHGVFLMLNVTGNVLIAGAALLVFLTLGRSGNRGAGARLLAGAAGSLLATLVSTAVVVTQGFTGLGPTALQLVLVATGAFSLASYAILAAGLWRLRPERPAPGPVEGGGDA